MSKFISKLIRNAKQIGIYQTVLFLTYDYLLKNKILSLKYNEFNLLFRSGTTDLNVIINALYRKEYQNIICNDPKFIIDAGAHIGTASIYFAEKYKNAKIFALEPEKNNYELLVKNTTNYKNIIPLNIALWSKKEVKSLNDRFTGAWGYSLISDDENEIQKIQCLSISDLMHEYKIDNIDILKLDIEGSEKEILENSSNWINNVNIITIELHDRIIMGCTRAFYLATKDFQHFQKKGEKITAYRNNLTNYEI